MDFRVSYCSVYNWSDTVLNLSYASWSQQSTDKKLRAPQVLSGRSWTTWAHHGFYALCLSLGRHLDFLISKGWKRINNKDQMPRKSAFRTWRVHTVRPRRWECFHTWLLTELPAMQMCNWTAKIETQRRIPTPSPNILVPISSHFCIFFCL